MIPSMHRRRSLQLGNIRYQRLGMWFSGTILTDMCEALGLIPNTYNTGKCSVKTVWSSTSMLPSAGHLVFRNAYSYPGVRTWLHAKGLRRLQRDLSSWGRRRQGNLFFNTKPPCSLLHPHGGGNLLLFIPCWSPSSLEMQLPFDSKFHRVKQQAVLEEF